MTSSLSGGNSFTASGGGSGTTRGSVFNVAAADDITFSGVTGSWSCCVGNSSFNGPDGGSYAGGDTNLSSAGDISGIVDSSGTFFLVGVFLGSSLPASAPASLDFSPGGLTQTFSSLSPALGQVFFIGDGLTGTGTGTAQQFFAPTGAVQLYLGTADGYNVTGGPGFYSDNQGSLTGSLTDTAATPEPSSLILMATAVCGLLAMRFRRVSRPQTLS